MEHFFKIEYSKRAVEQIKKLKGKIALQIKGAIERISKDPTIGKPLHGELKGYFSYRTSRYRIIYEIVYSKITIIIVAIGHRKDIYHYLGRI